MRKASSGLAAAVGILLAALPLAALAKPPEPPSTPPTAPWPMFHHDPYHSGLTPGVGNVPPNGPLTLWRHHVAPALDLSAPSTELNSAAKYRWYSSFPIGDLDGDGITNKVVVTTPANVTAPNRVIALKYTNVGGHPQVQELWTYTSPIQPGQGDWGVDQYSAALVDCDGDGILDVVFAEADGNVRCLRGRDGEQIWAFQTGYFIEAGPMVADVTGDGRPEIIMTTGCFGGIPCATSQNVASGALFVLSARGQQIWPTLELGAKADSAEPAIVDLRDEHGNVTQVILIGTWGSKLVAAWQDASSTIRTAHLNVRELDPHYPYKESSLTVIRSSPLIVAQGRKRTAVFGWLPDESDPIAGVKVGRISAVELKMHQGTVTFHRLWTLDRFDWKSSPAFLPVNPQRPLVVTAYGLGNKWNTANYGVCDSDTFGGILAIDLETGHVVWEHDFTSDLWTSVLGHVGGNIPGSAAVADIDGDGRLDVLITLGCEGELLAFDGETGDLKWIQQLGPRTIGSPTLGDLDGTGTLKIVVPSYDGSVWFLGGP